MEVWDLDASVIGFWWESFQDSLQTVTSHTHIWGEKSWLFFDFPYGGHWSHLRVSTFMTLIISERPHIQVSSQWDLAFNVWMWGSHKSVCNTNLARYILNQKNTLIINIACQALNDLPTSYFLSSVKRTPFFMYTITESPSIMPSLCLNTCLHSCLIFLLKCVSYLSLPHS